MSQYPTYYPQQMYTGYNPQMQMQQNPTMYMDRLSQLHAQQMQQPQIPVANQFAPLGKMVDSVEVVKATDIRPPSALTSLTVSAGSVTPST